MLTREETLSVAKALWQAHKELNTILARDGVPYTQIGYKSDVCPEYFEQVVHDAYKALETLTNETGYSWVRPWMPKIGEEQ